MQENQRNFIYLLLVFWSLSSCKAPQYSLKDSLFYKYSPIEWEGYVSLPDSLKGVNLPDFLESDTLNIVMYGINHPFFPADNMGMKTFGYNLSHLSPNFDLSFPFHTGQELKSTLIELSKMGYTLNNICIAGHSGYYGFFVEDGAGFYVNDYVYRKNRKIVPFNEGVLFIKDLSAAIASDSIKLSSDGLWLFAGCNTSSRNPSFADEMVRISGRPAISANQKVDLFNVPKVGMFLRGTEGGTFYIHELNRVTAEIKKLDVHAEMIEIDRVFNAYRKYDINKTK